MLLTVNIPAAYERQCSPQVLLHVHVGPEHEGPLLEIFFFICELCTYIALWQDDVLKLS
jgi:hypothetical protein